MYVETLPASLDWDDVECDGDDEVGEELVDFDQHQHQLSQEVVGSHDRDAFEGGAREVVVPVEVETEHNCA